MRNDANVVLGMHVRLLPNFYTRRSLPPANWTGVITDLTKTMKGQPSKYRVLLDAEFHLQAKEVEAFEYELGHVSKGCVLGSA
jgi:hypothetical protein